MAAGTIGRCWDGRSLTGLRFVVCGEELFDLDAEDVGECARGLERGWLAGFGATDGFAVKTGDPGEVGLAPAPGDSSDF